MKAVGKKSNAGIKEPYAKAVRKKKDNTGIKEPYENWLKNQEALKRIATMIEKVGFPLERAARKTFEKSGFYLYSDRYYSDTQDTDGKEVLREIDIQCETGFKEDIEVMGCKVQFELSVVAECKYSSTNDYFIFDSEEELFWEFPILFDHNDLFQYDPLERTFGNYFRFPVRIENIVEVDVGNGDFHKTDKTIHDGATQLTNALAYFGRKTSDIGAQILPESLIREYKEAINFQHLGRSPSDKEKQHQTRNEIAQDLLPHLDLIKVHSWVPILILGKNNGLLRVHMNGERVTGFSDTRYGLYFLRPVRTPSFFNLRRKANKDAIPIVVCNYRYLDECISMLGRGIQQMIVHARRAIADDPLLVMEVVTKQYDMYQARIERERSKP